MREGHAFGVKKTQENETNTQSYSRKRSGTFDADLHETVFSRMGDMLNPWFESVVVVSIAVSAFLLGRWFSHLPKPYWLIGYAIPLGLIVLYCIAIFVPELTNVPPVSWMMIGRSRFVSFNFVATMMLSAPLTRLTQKRNRVVVCTLIAVLTAMSVVPFLAPAFNRSYLAGLKTRMDPDGVCRQSNEYTCGPAAAVSALRKLGLPAEEGEIAILARTSSLTGTEPDVLAKVIQNRYRTNGLVVEYRSFRDLDELKHSGPTIAVMKFNALQDHCVTVFCVDTNGVLVADPLSGLSVVPAEEFENKWLFVGIVLKRVGNGL
jgi:predicted double-glycine peptidase